MYDIYEQQFQAKVIFVAVRSYLAKTKAVVKPFKYN